MFTAAAGFPPKTLTNSSKVSVLFAPAAAKFTVADGPGTEINTERWKVVPGPAVPAVSRLTVAFVPGSEIVTKLWNVESLIAIVCPSPGPVERCTGPANVDLLTLIWSSPVERETLVRALNVLLPRVTVSSPDPPRTETDWFAVTVSKVTVSVPDPTEIRHCFPNDHK